MNRLIKVDKVITTSMERIGVPFLRYSLALIFVWFGLLKTLSISPGQELVSNTVYWFSPSWFVPLLGWWEVVIGLCFLYKPFIRVGITLLALQMIGTFLPLILLLEVVYNNFNPFILTLEGQYIIKNLVILGAALVIGSHVRERHWKNNLFIPSQAGTNMFAFFVGYFCFLNKLNSLFYPLGYKKPIHIITI